MTGSPYDGVPANAWRQRTIQLIKSHPLKPKELIEVTLGAWKDIFTSTIGHRRFRIGTDIFPKPQIVGFLLHELIALEFARRYPDKWRGEQTAGDKDLVYIPDATFSIEIKTSSHPCKIFGNRSYTQERVGGRKGKKSKSGYYLTVNFEKCASGLAQPRLILVKFGWLDASDWRGQKAATGQQANLSSKTEGSKLIQLFPECQV